MKNTFPLEIVSVEGVLFQDEVESVYLFGAEGEFELLPFHYPLVASLVTSEINIAGNEPLPIQSGVVMFNNNECKVIVEVPRGSAKVVKAWS